MSLSVVKEGYKFARGPGINRYLDKKDRYRGHNESETNQANYKNELSDRT